MCNMCIYSIFSGKCDGREELQRGGGGHRGENHHHRGKRILLTCRVAHLMTVRS